MNPDAPIRRVGASAAAIFMIVLSVLAIELGRGHDPALGQATAAPVSASSSATVTPQIDEVDPAAGAVASTEQPPGQPPVRSAVS